MKFCVLICFYQLWLACTFGVDQNYRRGPDIGGLNHGRGSGPGGRPSLPAPELQPRPVMPPIGNPPQKPPPPQTTAACPWCKLNGHNNYYSEKEYQELMKQVETGNKNDQCPCVKRPGTELCMTYDPRYQAATLPEAIQNFPDLTNDDDTVAYDPSNPWRSLGYGSLECKPNDNKCKQCTMAMISHLSQEGIIDNTTVTQLNAQFSIAPVYYHASGSQNFNCERYYFSRPGRHGNSWSSHGNSWRDSTNQATDSQERVSNFPNPRRGGRGKRETTESLGTSQNVISCVNRGESENVNSELMNLCSMCWVWRQLPSQYFPTYVNELVCSKTEPSCLSDQGSCKQRYRNLNFLQNLGTEAAPKWEAVSLAAGTSCECHALKGSSIENLVTGTGKK